MEKDRYLLSSLNNALGLLDLLSHASSLSLAELTHLSGMDKASVFRSLYTLEKNGYVQKLPEARYRLGMKFLYYGNLVAAQQDIVTAARPALQNLTLRCKLAVHLSCLNQERVVTICKEESPYDIQVTARVGMNAPAYATAMGQAILAFLPEKQLDVLLDRYTYKRYSPRSVTDQNQCRAILAEVRRSGYATDIDDRFPGFGSVACPVFDPSNHVIAAVGVVGLAQTIQDCTGNYVAELRKTASAITEAIREYN